MHLLGYLLQHHNPHKRLWILLCKNSLSGTTRSIRLSDYFPILWIKASLNGLNPWFLSESSPWPTGKEKYTVLRRYQSLTNLIRRTKTFCLIASLVFRRFYLKTEAPQLPQKVQTLLVWYFLLEICIIVYSCTGYGTSKVYLCLEDNRSSFSRVSLKSETMDVHP